MPLSLPTNSVITVRHEYALYSDRAFNVMHYRFVNATVIDTGLPAAVEIPAAPALSAAAETFATVFSPLWAAAASNQVTYTGCTVQKTFPGDRTTPYHYQLGDALAGDVAGDALPLQDSATILKRTDYGQRWGLGRFFYVGLAESEQQQGILQPTTVTALGILASQLQSAYVIDDGTYQTTWRPVVTNVPTTGYPRVNDVLTCELSNNIVKSQRRRRPGKGI